MKLRSNDPENNAPLPAVFILSGTALAYEILLIRLFSIIHWHHFAFMVISIALLGYGASGSFITLFRERLLSHFENALMLNALMFGISSLACFLWVQSIPFNALEILWDVSQWLRLLLTYVLLSLPFFFVANVIALSMVQFPRKIALIYAYDLIGAGLGAVFVMALLQVLTAESVLRTLAVLGLSGGWFLLHRQKRYLQKTYFILLILSLIAVSLIPQQWLNLRISEFKGLPQSLLIKDSELLWTHHSPQARIDVVESPFIPIRHAPGLSLNSPYMPPRQLAVFSDAEAMTALDHVTDPVSLRYTDYLSSALPYHVHDDAKDILLLDSGSGGAILHADYQEISNITAVEPDGHLSQLARVQFADITGWSRIQSHVSDYTMTARAFAAQAARIQRKFDLIILGPSAASTGAAAGVNALMSAYNVTTEAFQSYMKLLTPGGFFSLSEWTSNPPRSSLKLFNTIVEALKRQGVSHPENNLAWIRSWNTATLLVKDSALTPAEIEKVRHFSLERGFDLAWLPGISINEVNQFQQLQRPLFFETAQSTFNPSSLINPEYNSAANYQFDIEPSTDNRPFFNHYFKWSGLKEFLSLPGGSGLSLVEVGYPTLLITLGQALLAGLIFILLPLLLVRRKYKQMAKPQFAVLVYFACVGLAFLFIELAIIDRFTLILGQPLYAVAVSLSAFLIFSGLGSLYIQQRLDRSLGTETPLLVGRSVLVIGLLSLLYVVFLPELGNTIMTYPESIRLVFAFLLTAPLAFAMGMPLPLGLASLRSNGAELIPWAWGINGCASVLSAVLAILLAMEIGFSGVILCAVLLYALAWRSLIKSY